MEIVNVPVNAILDNTTYRFTSHSDSEILTTSIHQSGILQPVQLVKQDAVYCIVSGFQRVFIAQKLKFKEIPCYIIPNNEIPEFFKAGLSEHVSTRKLNVIEKARILKIVSDFNQPSEAVLQDIFQLIELNRDSKYIQTYLDILNFHPELIAYIEMYDASLKQATAFKIYNSEAQSLFVQLAQTLNIRIVELDAIAQLFFQISRRDDISVAEIYNQMEIESIIQSDAKTRSQKIQQIKKTLIQKRFPKINEWQTTIHEEIQTLSLPVGTDILWDKNLEAPGITFKINLKNIKDLEKFQSFLSDPELCEALEKIFKILG